MTAKITEPFLLKLKRLIKIFRYIFLPYSAGFLPALFLIIFLFQNNPVSAQQVKLLLKDEVTSQPIEFAHVQAYSLSGQKIKKTISDSLGTAVVDMEFPFLVKISSMGYKPFIDTLFQEGSYELNLSPEFYQLDKVVVTGQFRPQPVDKSIYKIDIIDNHTITLKGANSLNDLVQNELNFQYRYESVLGGFLRIRGLSGENIKILIDGMPVTGRMLDKLDLGQLSLYNVDHIECIEGPMSVVYGSNAMAGAVNIITREDHNPGLTLNSAAYYETVGVYNFDVSVSEKIGNHQISLNAARNFYSGWGPIDTSRFKIWKPKRQYIADADYSFRRNDFKVQLQSDFITEELRDQDSLSLENLYEKALDAYHFTTRWNSRLNIANTYHDDFLMNLLVGYSYYEKRKITYLNDLVNLERTPVDNPQLYDTTLFHLVTARTFISNITGSAFEYQTGLDFSYESAFGKRTQGYQHITDGALFMNFIFHAYNIISMQPGIRYIYNSKYKAPLIYALNLKLNPGSFVFRASYAKGFRAPSLKQLYLEFIDNNHEIYGNPELKQETGNSFNLSFDYSFKKGKQTGEITLNTYYNSISDAIQLVIDTLRPGWATYINIPGNNLKTQGIETYLKYFFAPQLSLGFGINLTGRNKLDRTDQYVYSTDVAGSIKYQNPRNNFELAMFYKYFDDYLEFNGNFNPQGELDGIAQRFISHYHSMDLTFSKTFPDLKIILTSGIKNIFNVTLVDSYGNLNFHGSDSQSSPAGYGRTFFIKLQYRFEKAHHDHQQN